MSNAKTIAELLVIFADGQIDGSISEADVREFVLTTAIREKHQWEQRVDDAKKLEANAQTILAGVRTKITIDGIDSGSNVTYAHQGNVWNASTNKIEPLVIGDTYNLRFEVKSKFTSGSTNFLTLELDIGGTPGIIWADDKTYLKGAGVTTQFAWGFPIFTLDTFVSNGGELYITPDTDAIFWDLRLMVQRSFTPDVF